MSCLEKTSHCLLSGQYIHAVKQGSGNTMLWEWFSAAGTGRLVKIEGKINRETSWLKTYSRELLTSDWDDGSSFSRTRIPIQIKPVCRRQDDPFSPFIPSGLFYGCLSPGSRWLRLSGAFYILAGWTGTDSSTAFGEDK